MADYWKSQPKKFCDYCKCWIADNKPSIDFHERGKNHKENVAKKISEIKKKSLEKAKEEEKMAKEFAAMEEAATKAYQEDLKRLGVKAESIGHSSVPKKQEEKKEKKEKKKKGKQSTESSSRKRKEWVRGFSSEGYTYYYNTISGESQWEKPEGFQDATPDTKATAVWIEGASEDGQTYYYNVETGGRICLVPIEMPAVTVRSDLVRQLYSLGCILNMVFWCGNLVVFEADVASSHLEYPVLSTEADGSEQKISTWEKPEGFVTPLVKKNKNENLSEETDVNAEDSDDDGKGKAGSDEETEDRPRKPQKFSPYGEWQEVKQKRRNQKARLPVSQETPKTSSQTAKPYGKWKEITEENPPEDVDLELPSADGDGLPAPVLEVPEDAKVIFKEKTVTSLGSEVAEETPVFKKRKFENGKSRNLRQRLNDL